MNRRMKFVIGGGTGFLGSRLADRLSADGHEVVLLARHPRPEHRPGVRMVQWRATGGGDWIRELDGAGAVINLAGEPMDSGWWTSGRKRRILGSRVDAARALVDAIRAAAAKPSVFINASGVHYYGDVPQGEVTEDRKAGEGFMPDMCARWEAEAARAGELGVRVAMMRMAFVLGEESRGLAKMILQFRLYVGGPLGDGTQWFPWVHPEDVTGAMLHVLENPAISGPVNVAAPESVTMRQFSMALGNALHRPCWLRVPAPLLRLVVGEMAEVVLTGQKIIPQKLLAGGYKFRYPNVLEALEAAIR